MAQICKTIKPKKREVLKQRCKRVMKHAEDKRMKRTYKVGKKSPHGKKANSSCRRPPHKPPHQPRSSKRNEEI